MSVGEYWPEWGVQSNEWTLNRRDSAPAALSGNSIAVPLGEPFWTIDVRVEVPQRSALAREWSAFFARRQGRKNSFTANRSFQSFPARLAESGMPPANATATAIDRADSTVNVSNANGSAWRMAQSDMIGFYTAQQGYYIGEVTAILSANDTAQRVRVEPPPFPPHATQDAFRAVKAVGEFRLDRAPRLTETSSRRAWTFTATQVIRG